MPQSALTWIAPLSACEAVAGAADLGAQSISTGSPTHRHDLHFLQKPSHNPHLTMKNKVLLAIRFLTHQTLAQSQRALFKACVIPLVAASALLGSARAQVVAFTADTNGPSGGAANNGGLNIG